MNQNAQILKHLKRRPITSMQAFNRYGITRLSGRIYDLRKEGHRITSERVTKNGATFARYRLEESHAQV